MATEEDGGAFGIGPVSSKPGNYPDEQAAETLHEDGGAITSAVLLRKRGNIPNGSEPP